MVADSGLDGVDHGIPDLQAWGEEMRLKILPLGGAQAGQVTQ